MFEGWINMEKILDSLKNSKVVLFGAAENGKNILKQLIDRGIRPAYFVDNNPVIKKIEFSNSSEEKDSFAIHAPEMLLNEDKSSLKIIITPYAPSYTAKEAQIKEMGLGACLFPTNVKSCFMLQNYLIFLNEGLRFCCNDMANFTDFRPEFPYLETAEKTIVNFLEKRKLIIDDLNDCSGLNDNPCRTCSNVNDRFQLFDTDKIKLKLISISDQPTVCQARCIYCGLSKDPKNTYEAAKQSRYPAMIAEIVKYLQSNDYLAHDCNFHFSGGEITILPQKDFLLDVAKGNMSIFFTNAFLFDQKIANSLRDNGSTINVSLDSGTRETFKLVKGHDLFEKVIENLKKYREYGDFELKYNIIPGINDNDNDIGGITYLIKSLGAKIFFMSFDFNLPLRSSFYPIVKFIAKLKEKGVSFAFRAYYSVSQIENFIEQYYTPEYQSDLEKKNHHLRETFQSKYTNDYRGYRKYVYITEIKDLIERFKEGTRFALLGSALSDKFIVSAFQELGIPLQTPDMPYKESYDAAQDNADVFIIRNKGKFSDIKAYIESKGGKGGQLLDVEKYYYSFEPAKLFLERNTIEEYFR